MCGIAGIINPKNIGENTLKDMCDTIAHRGPDAEGSLYLPEIHLGHRRLSIIDLSENAKQPMHDIHERYHIVFNGEIYNYKELKTELQNKGYSFLNQSDTEVILCSYAEWGKDCLAKFNGMFAFVIWDSKEKIAFIAKDRFGKKPFYYSHLSDGQLVFASECTAVLKHPEVNAEKDPEAINCYLAIGYILAPLSIYKSIRKLPAASYAIYKFDQKSLHIHKYWHYEDYLSQEKTENEKLIEEKLRSLLLQSVKYRLIADVPVGAFLSGGVDSSSVVAAIRKLHNNPLHTFSIGFDQETYSELNEAKTIASLFHTAHHEELLNVENSKEILLPAIESFDEPFADNSLIPMFKVSELAKEHVKVVLSGDGADEIFAGYITYKADSHYQKFKHIPSGLRSLGYQLVKNNKITEKQKIGFQYKLRQFLQGARGDYASAHYAWRLIFTPELRKQIMGEQYSELIYQTDPVHAFRKHFKQVDHLHWLDQALYVDAMTWLSDDILVKVDRTTMRHGIEARAPYLDKELVEYAASIHPRLKLKSGVTKSILKNSLKPWLPAEVLFRKKSGFNAPVGAWIGNKEGDEFRSFNKFVYNQKVNGTTS